MSAFTYHDIHHDDVSSSISDLDPLEPFESYPSQAPSRPRPYLPAIPDLRFEQSYLKSIKRFVHIEESSEPRRVDEKGKGKENIEQDLPTDPEIELVVRRDVTPIVDVSHRVIGIEWGQVIWVTTRDQVISPLLQGALWSVH